MISVLCPSCGNGNSQDALFCERCGAGVPLGCSSCKRQNNPGSRYCRFCRSSLVSNATGATWPTPGSPPPVRPAKSPSVFANGRQMVRGVVDRLDQSESQVSSVWQSTLAELVGTMLFVFFGAGVVVVSGSLTGGELTVGRLAVIAVAHGLAIALLVYATASISGGHLNPAVTLGAMITRNITAAKGLRFIAAQVVGATFGALAIAATIPNAMDASLGAHELAPGVPDIRGLILEVIITFALVFVIFATVIDRKGIGRLAPLAIGLTVLLGSFVAVPITGASMNPARSLGPALVAAHWETLWLYWAGPLAGGVLASLGYQYLFIRRPG